MKKSLFYLLLILILFRVNYGGAQQLTFNKVTPPRGSFNGTVVGITQDNNGYMWIASEGGLYKYDGYRFKLYANDPANPNSAASLRLETVYADRKGSVWLATWVDGLDRLDPTTNTFIHFRHNPNESGSLSNDTVRSILEDRDGILWVGTYGGLDRYDSKTNRFYNYHHDSGDPNSLSCNHVRKLYEDREGNLWVATGSVWAGEGGETDEGGLNRFNKKTGKFIRYLHDPKNPHSLINNKVQGILEDSRGTFWVGTAGDGLHTMDRSTGTFERHLYDPAHPEKLSRPALKNTLGPDHITAITEDALGNIWIGTLGNGISRYDPKTNKVVHYTNKDTAAGFTDNSGWTFYNSKDGILWIGTWQGSLFRVDPYHKNIPHVITGSYVNAFHEDPGNNLWIGTSEGLILQNKTTGAFKKFVHDPHNLSSISESYITSLFRDSEGTLWIGTINGLNRFNESTHSFINYVNNPGDPNSIATGTISVEDADGDSLWIGTINGLNLMNKRTGTFTHFRNDTKDTNSLTSNNISVLQRDKSGNLWVGTLPGGGLNYFDQASRTFKHFLKGITVLSLLRDASGILWIGTEGEGLYRSNKAGDGFIKITDPGSGIENAVILSMVQDNQKNIWMSANTGIYRMNPRTGQTTVYSANYGINAGNLNYYVGYKGRDGKIYFGDVSGYYVFAPDELMANPTPPQVILTGFRIGGKSVIPGKGSPLTDPLEKTEKIRLNYSQNVIAFDFAAIHYSSPEQNRHLYKLENYDPEWREAGTEKTAYYFNVPPGHYIFKVRAGSSEGVWAERDLNIIVTPPWWRTWWAFCIYGLLFITGAFVIDRIQRRRLIERERARTREKELVQAREIEKAYNELKRTQEQLIQSEKMASLGELMAGIAHEIQNPLNFVKNFSEVNVELLEELEKATLEGDREEVHAIVADMRNNLQKVVHHEQRADAIVKNMLQHSRKSSGQKEPTDMNALTDEYLRLSYHGMKAKDKLFNATVQTDFDSTVEKINVIPQDIGRVLLNLFNNAFYSVSEKKKTVMDGYEPVVSVSTRRMENQFEIRVWDNGVGISGQVVNKIFQPFFTTKPAGEGTGLGLSLSYDIIKVHGGELKVDTKEGESAEFIIHLPVQA